MMVKMQTNQKIHGFKRLRYEITKLKSTISIFYFGRFLKEVDSISLHGRIQKIRQGGSFFG